MRNFVLVTRTAGMALACVLALSACGLETATAAATVAGAKAQEAQQAKQQMDLKFPTGSSIFFVDGIFFIKISQIKAPMKTFSFGVIL